MIDLGYKGLGRCNDEDRRDVHRDRGCSYLGNCLARRAVASAIESVGVGVVAVEQEALHLYHL